MSSPPVNSIIILLKYVNKYYQIMQDFKQIENKIFTIINKTINI